MIRVDISANAKNRVGLEEWDIHIRNDGTGDSKVGNYICILSCNDDKHMVRVTKFDRGRGAHCAAEIDRVTAGGIEEIR